MQRGIGPTGPGYDVILGSTIRAGQRAGLFTDDTAHRLNDLDLAGIATTERNTAQFSAGNLGREEFTTDGVKIIPTDGGALFASLDQLDKVGLSNMADIRVVTVYGADGVTPVSYQVLIPSTMRWFPDSGPGTTPNDLTSDVMALRYGDQTALANAVYDAMEQAGIPKGEGAPPVTMAGFSLGGITAAAIAADSSNGYHITQVVTAGSPIGGFEIPDDIAVTSFEQTSDPVTTLDGAVNPATPNWTTIRVDTPLFAKETTVNPLDATSVHAADRYAMVAQQSGIIDDALTPADASASVSDFYYQR